MNAIRTNAGPTNAISTNSKSDQLLSAQNPWRASFALALIAILLFGFVYSLAATGLGRLLFPQQATGSMLERDGRIVGSTLVAQPFADAGYFQPRPSAAAYDAMALSGSNQARTNPDMRARVNAARSAVTLREGVRMEDVPSDLVTQSGSGVDPQISPDAATLQIARVAKARGMDPASIERLVAAHVEKRQLGIFGEARVNVLELNLALDALHAPSGAK